MLADTVILGAVAYDPKVVTIWDRFREISVAQGRDSDFLIYSNSERQVEATLRSDVDVA